MIFSYSDTTTKICKLYPDLADNTVTKNMIRDDKVAKNCSLSLRANQIEPSRERKTKTKTLCPENAADLYNLFLEARSGLPPVGRKTWDRSLDI